MATTASIATTAPRSCSVRVKTEPSIVTISKRSIASRRCRSGHRIAVITEPSAISLKRPLAKLAIACLPKIRLAPDAGEILESFGLSDSPDQTSRCCRMLPAIAAKISMRNGIPSAAIKANSRFFASASRPGPSVFTIHELAIRLRSGVLISPIEPEKLESTSVAPAIMNQVLTSWLLATSPRSSASSRRFCVGSSVRSPESSSSAIFKRPLLERNQVVQDGNEVVEEASHHGRQNDRKDQKTGHDRQRHADKIDLHLRHQARQHAQSDIEDKPKDQKGCR